MTTNVLTNEYFYHESSSIDSGLLWDTVNGSCWICFSFHPRVKKIKLPRTADDIDVKLLSIRLMYFTINVENFEEDIALLNRNKYQTRAAKA